MIALHFGQDKGNKIIQEITNPTNLMALSGLCFHFLRMLLLRETLMKAVKIPAGSAIKFKCFSMQSKLAKIKERKKRRKPIRNSIVKTFKSTAETADK